jgi:regulation of enolase protein 1 (concanavalin A-like superfamily)
LSLPCLIESAPFDPAALVGVDVGNPSIPGSTTAHAGFVEMTSVGAIGFKSDQFHFASSEQPGDFDVRVRVASLKNTDLWAKAGLMLRADKNAGDRFAGVFATPSGAGCLFQARLADQGAAASQGFFPANQPFTWLRLRRTGDTIAGYAGYDGSHWTPLGNQVLALGTHAFLGLVVCSHSTNATSAEFRDLGAAVDPKIEQVPVTIEPLGPSSRRTALVISEIMYHPADSPDGKNLEFIELYNSQPYFEDISGWKLDGDVEFTFPPGTLIPGGAFLVVAGAPEDLRLAYALDNVLGPFSGKLANAGGNLRLEGAHNAVYLEVDYKDKAPWPELADGAGHSLVLVRPSYGEADPFAWSASRIKGGSPGMPEAVEIASTSGVRINECQLPDADGAGFVELFNGGTLEADLGGGCGWADRRMQRRSACPTVLNCLREASFISPMRNWISRSRQPETLSIWRARIAAGSLTRPPSVRRPQAPRRADGLTGPR